MPGFLEPTIIRAVLVLCALTGLASIGQTLVVLIRGIDLSLAGFIVAGAVMVTRFSAVADVPVLVMLMLAVACGAAMGALVGYICHRFVIHPIIVTPNTVLFLASDESAFFTGQTLSPNGG